MEEAGYLKPKTPCNNHHLGRIYSFDFKGGYVSIYIYKYPGSPWPPFLLGWLPNHHFLSKGLSSSNLGTTIFKMVTSRVYI